MLYDAHIHDKCCEKGGFLIGLEINPMYENTLTNKEVLELQNKDYLAFYYVKNNEISKKLPYLYLKYHPRKEKYAKSEVIKSISLNSPKCIILDTLNEPYWSAYDYWEIARNFPDTPFLFSHAGGYLINDFIKICNFQKNVWLDFSCTQKILGDFNKGLFYINDAIKFSLNSSFKEHILFGSDYPFFSQEEAYLYYKNLGVVDLLNTNFEKLLARIK